MRWCESWRSPFPPTAKPKRCIITAGRVSFSIGTPAANRRTFVTTNLAASSTSRLAPTRRPIPDTGWCIGWSLSRCTPLKPWITNPRKGVFRPCGSKSRSQNERGRDRRGQLRRAAVVLRPDGLRRDRRGVRRLRANLLFTRIVRADAAHVRAAARPWHRVQCLGDAFFGAIALDRARFAAAASAAGVVRCGDCRGHAHFWSGSQRGGIAPVKWLPATAARPGAQLVRHHGVRAARRHGLVHEKAAGLAQALHAVGDHYFARGTPVSHRDSDP